jgi:hypothetical protein
VTNGEGLSGADWSSEALLMEKGAGDGGGLGDADTTIGLFPRGIPGPSGGRVALDAAGIPGPSGGKGAFFI